MFTTSPLVLNQSGNVPELTTSNPDVPGMPTHRHKKPLQSELLWWAILAVGLTKP